MSFNIDNSNNLAQYNTNVNDIIYYYNKNMLEYHHNIENILKLCNRNIIENSDNNSSRSTRSSNSGNSGNNSNNSNIRINNTRNSNATRLSNTRTTNTPSIQTTLNSSTSSNYRSRPNNFVNRYIRSNNDNYRNYFTFIPLTTTNTNANLTTTTSSSSNILSDSQLQLSTEIIKYTAEMNDAICPISFEDFIIDEEVIKIKMCGHYFKKPSLLNWLLRSHVCPVCRYDLNSYVENSSGEIQDLEEPIEHELEIPEIDLSDTENTDVNTNHETYRNEISTFLESIIRNIDSEISTSFDFSNNQFVAEYSIDLFNDINENI